MQNFSGQNKKRRVLSDLLSIGAADELLAAVLDDTRLSSSGDDANLVANAYAMTVRLYRGEWRAYLACDVGYHDISHVVEVFLAMGRLIRGAVLDGIAFNAREIALGLTAAILHDAGYIRRDSEQACRGARFRAQHEQRGMAFLTRHGARFGLTADEIIDARSMIQSTRMAENIDAIPFRTAASALLGRMLAAADLLAQLSSSTYLEKLVDLYEEDQRANNPSYKDRLDCFRKAIAFDAFASDRLHAILPSADSYLTSYFEARWKVSQNLYALAIERQIQRLDALLQQTEFKPRRHLRRWGSLAAMRRIFQ